MKSQALFAIAVLVLALGGLALAAQAPTGGDKVMFPEDYADGVLYWTQDRPRNNQVREYYTSQAAIEAAGNDAELPSGTVITVVQYNIELGANDEPATSPDGRLIKTDIRGYTAMEKRTGWGSEYPEDVRNGEWEYQSFTADRSPNSNADLSRCFGCHAPQGEQDYVFSYPNIKAPE